MSIHISIKNIVGELDALSDQHQAYLNKVTGEIVTIMNEEAAAYENGRDWSTAPDWQQDALALAEKVLSSKDYVALPSKFDVHEYAIMEEFCYSIEDSEINDDMLNKIRGSGAFRRFKNAIHHYGIQDDWYDFKHQALERIVRGWLEDNGIEIAENDTKIVSAIAQLNHQAQAIRSLLEGIGEEQMRWKPDPKSWSLLEVLNHLYDEEQFDFRVCLDYLLHHPGEDWPPVDPEKWVVERKYNQRDPQQSLDNFMIERQKSLGWLEGLGSPDWDQGTPAPWGGTLTAGDMLAAWQAHDLLHIRQINELLYAWTVQTNQPYSAGYAGEW